MNDTYLTRIHFEDTDCAGVVYHSNYLNYMERARSEWIEKLGFGIDWQRQQDANFAVRSAQVDFLKPARLHQWLEVYSTIKEIRRASLIFNQCLRLKDAPDTIICTAEIKVACIDQQFRPRALPEELTNLLMNPCGERL